ncbi:hypothetical protein pf16_159 [Pseudomonas phage pf16]|uniref:Uncharacterized protein n=1 Tax=Pseudomonas phage pf16 TaxID=1815630 RepID=A0A1S5R3T6_9CAUD|nr:hypothetical protein FDG98_gp139 [Pseudomonas phage pf16]AND75082.1 hypothetical protein pf16_159 [Pseudomonas phage pf16]
MINIIVGMAILIANVLNLICISVDWYRATNVRIKNHYGLMMAASIAMTVVMVVGVHLAISTTPLHEM